MKPFSTLAAVIFALMAVVHMLRLIFGWSVIVGGIAIPIWVSAVAVLFTAGLAVMLSREARR